MTGLQELAQLGGTLATVLLFLLYLQRKDKLNKETYDQFNATINNHLQYSNQIIKENSDTQRTLAIKLQQLSDCIKTINKKKI